MKYKVKLPNHSSRHPDDVRRIVKIFADKGHELSLRDAEAAWELFSETYCAGWNRLPACDDEIFNSVLPFLMEDS